METLTVMIRKKSVFGPPPRGAFHFVKCLSKNTPYQADISSENFQKKIYYGVSETKFKTRYSNHKKSFNHEKHENDTQLSNELWKI